MFSIEPPIPAAKRRLRPGLRPLGALLAAFALMCGLTGTAAAASRTVDGTGEISKMNVNNGSRAVVVKVYGPDIECGVSRWVTVVMRDSDGTTYKAIGGCYPGGVWIASLERGASLVNCDGFRLNYNDTGFWRVEAPRSCLNRLANRIKVKSELASGSPTPGLTPFTPWIARG